MTSSGSSVVGFRVGWMVQLRVRVGGEGRRVLERQTSGMHCQQGRRWATPALVGGWWCEVQRGNGGIAEGVCTDENDRMCWLRCHGQWSGRRGVGSGGRLQTENSWGHEQYVVVSRGGSSTEAKKCGEYTWIVDEKGLERAHGHRGGAEESGRNEKS